MTLAPAARPWRARLGSLLPGALLVLTSLIILPVFIMGLPCSHDAYSHMAKAAELYFNAQGGAPFLQWSPDLMRGYGHPVLAFYAPLMYWLLAAPHWLGVTFDESFRSLAYLALVAGGIGMFVFARRYLSPPAAFVAGLTYLFAPYLMFDAIQRGALPETVALGVLPYCLAAVGAAARQRTARRVVLAGLMMAVLISLHNLVPIFAVPLCLLVAAFEGLASEKKWALRQVLAEAWRGLLAGSLALGLAVFVTTAVWLPAATEVRQTLTGQPNPPASPDLSNWPRYGTNLVPVAELARWPSEPGDWQLYNAPISRGLGLVPAIFSVLAALALLHPAVWRRYPVLAALGLAALGSLFLSSEASRWLWDYSRLLQVVQLPTRLLGPTNVGVALLCGLFVELLIARINQPVVRAAAVVLPAIAIVVCGFPWLFPRYCTPPTLTAPAGVAQPLQPNTWMYEPLGELLPQWVQALPPERPLTDQYAAGVPVNRLTWPAGQVVQTSWQTGRADDRYTLQAAQPTLLTYQTFYFPGWQATLDGKPVDIQVSSPYGLIEVNLPAGTHVLEIAFQHTPLRTAAALVSAIGLLVCLSIVVMHRRIAAPAPLAPVQSFAGHMPAALAGTAISLLVLFFLVLPHFVTPILGQRLHGERLAGVQHPASVAFEQELRFLGYNGPDEIRADQAFELDQYWKAEHPLGLPYAFAARIADDQGHSWNLPSDRPFDYGDYQGAEGWPTDAYVRDAYVMRLLPGTPPGRYWIEVNTFRRDTSLQLVPQAGTPTSPDPAWARVGQIQVLPPRSEALPDDAAVAVVRPTSLGAGLTLAGWTLPSGQINAGDVVHVTLLWQASQRQSDGLSLQAQVVDNSNRSLANFALSPGGDIFPIILWPDVVLVRDQLEWRVPSTTPSGAYRVVVHAGPKAADLGQLQVVAPQHRFDLPPAATPLDQVIGFARLAGYTLTPAVPHPGDTISVDLVWQAVTGTVQAYRVFVHLRGPDGRPIAQSDSAPANWRRPTSGWVPGEYIVDSRSLTLPPKMPAGAYSLVVGLYDPASGTRLGEVTLRTVTMP